MDIFVGRTGNELCPVVAVLAYMVKGVQPGPPFDNIMLCGPFAASYTCEITGNGVS